MPHFTRNAFVDARGLPALKTILNEWIEVQRRCATAMKHTEQAWYYRERSCIGFLSAAVWQAGGITLEEWRTQKNLVQRFARCRAGEPGES